MFQEEKHVREVLKGREVILQLATCLYLFHVDFHNMSPRTLNGWQKMQRKVRPSAPKIHSNFDRGVGTRTQESNILRLEENVVWLSIMGWLFTKKFLCSRRSFVFLLSTAYSGRNG